MEHSTESLTTIARRSKRRYNIGDLVYAFVNSSFGEGPHICIVLDIENKKNGHYEWTQYMTYVQNEQYFRLVKENDIVGMVYF